MTSTPDNTEKSTSPAATETAYFAAGCFWGVEAAFRNVDGVTATAVGYMNGRTENPTYQQVCTNRTGHAESVKVEYDPAKVSYEELLDVFWSIHNPTTRNRQGPDIGTQYRSAIFFDSEKQYRAAVESKQELEHSGKFNRPIVTEIQRAKIFWPAEEYHQQYLQKRGKTSCALPLH